MTRRSCVKFIHSLA